MQSDKYSYDIVTLLTEKLLTNGLVDFWQGGMKCHYVSGCKAAE